MFLVSRYSAYVTEKGMETDYQIKRIILCVIVIVNEKMFIFSRTQVRFVSFKIVINIPKQ